MSVTYIAAVGSQNAKWFQPNSSKVEVIEALSTLQSRLSFSRTLMGFVSFSLRFTFFFVVSVTTTLRTMSLIHRSEANKCV